MLSSAARRLGPCTATVVRRVVEVEAERGRQRATVAQRLTTGGRRSSPSGCSPLAVAVVGPRVPAAMKRARPSGHYGIRAIATIAQRRVSGHPGACHEVTLTPLPPMRSAAVRRAAPPLGRRHARHVRRASAAGARLFGARRTCGPCAWWRWRRTLRRVRVRSARSAPTLVDRPRWPWPMLPGAPAGLPKDARVSYGRPTVRAAAMAFVVGPALARDDVVRRVLTERTSAQALSVRL